ncbi:ABC transporter permease [Paenibacillus contaminans]|uniref:Sugar ABC transporter permease n=1 Tax=Paenibacillus contaminans TaxID=450362 RepID=A0A329MPR1_9BACL|nr:ABC transporter permease subunit [Paenibacillus contaminans]RAV21276.1 sugar ABC transporter permease [Paenibacillus contaminans]
MRSETRRQGEPAARAAAGALPSVWRMLGKQKYLQMMIVPWIVWVIVFHYIPMYGVVIAFQEYQPLKGITGSPWVGFDQFRAFFQNPEFWNLMRNTLGISLWKLIWGFPMPILFALLLNELTGNRFKRFVQTVSYLPHFISWVVMAGIVYGLLSLDVGVINRLLLAVGLLDEPIMFLGDSRFYWPILIISDIWKELGWGAIIYLAAIAGVDPALYEAAEIDGANRLRKMVHITLPSIAPTIVILLIFQISGILNSSFDQLYLLQNPMVLDVGEVIDTYVYKTGLTQGRFSYSTAVGLFKSLIGFVLIVLVNRIAKKINGSGIW